MDIIRTSRGDWRYSGNDNLAHYAYIQALKVRLTRRGLKSVVPHLLNLSDHAVAHASTHEFHSEMISCIHVGQHIAYCIEREILKKFSVWTNGVTHTAGFIFRKNSLLDCINLEIGSMTAVDVIKECLPALRDCYDEWRVPPFER